MTKFSGIAQAHWEKHRPDEAATMTPADYAQIGADIASQVEILAEAIVAPPAPGETYDQVVARLTTARMTAESDVLREMLPEPTIVDLEDEDLEEELRHAHNSKVMFDAMLRDQAETIINQEPSENEAQRQRAVEQMVEQLRGDHQAEQSSPA
jgi:hypothetical protein